MDHVLGLKCTICGAEYGVTEVEYVCPHHGDDGILDVVYDYGLIGRRIDPGQLASKSLQSMWRYLALLPVEPGTAWKLAEGTVLASVGWTPLYPAPRLAAELGLKHLWIKDDSRQPTASFKDRASAIAVVKTRELGYEMVTTASTGTLRPVCGSRSTQRHLCPQDRSPGQDRAIVGLRLYCYVGERYLRPGL